MSPELEQAQVLEANMVIAVRHFETGSVPEREAGSVPERKGRHGESLFGEDMVLVTDGAPERLAALGYGPLASEG